MFILHDSKLFNIEIFSFFLIWYLLSILTSRQNTEIEALFTAKCFCLKWMLQSLTKTDIQEVNNLFSVLYSLMKYQQKRKNFFKQTKSFHILYNNYYLRLNIRWIRLQKGDEKLWNTWINSRSFPPPSADVAITTVPQNVQMDLIKFLCCDILDKNFM